MLLKRRPAEEGLLLILSGVPEEESPIPESNYVAPFACKLLSEKGFGFRKANVIGSPVLASHFPSDEFQDWTEVRGSTLVSANDWGENTAAPCCVLYWVTIV